MEWELEKAKDFAQWEKGDVEDSEVEELSEEAVKKAKAKVGGKGKEREKEEETEEKKKTTRAKRRLIEESDDEEDMVPSGWRPPKGSTVRSIYIVS